MGRERKHPLTCRDWPGPVAGGVLLAALAFTACVSSGLSSSAADVYGTWGGDGIRLTLTETGGTFELPCASGSLERPIVLDTRGRFRVMGQLEFTTPGPAVFPPPPGREPRTIRLSGRFKNGRLRLVLRRPAPRRPGEKARSVFRLDKGSTGQLERCR